MEHDMGALAASNSGHDMKTTYNPPGGHARKTSIARIDAHVVGKLEGMNERSAAMTNRETVSQKTVSP
jgi:hypothetical protein